MFTFLKYKTSSLQTNNQHLSKFLCFVSQIINLSSSANNLLTIQKKADEYAAMIMEVLDPHNIGYIMVNFLDNDLKTDKFSQYCFYI